MLKKIIHLSLITFVAALALVVSPAVSFAASGSNRDATCQGAQFAGASVDCSDGKLSDNQFGNVVRAVINILSVIVGAVSVIMIIIGGFRYVISNGDSNAVSGAKNTILYAIVGLVIVLFAQILVRFVITRVDPENTDAQSRTGSVVALR